MGAVMVSIGVRMPGCPVDTGEFLADGRALDAAGVDSLWLERDGEDAWMMAAALAAVTGRARLVVPVSPAKADLADRARTLDRLSRGRGAMLVEGDSAAAALLLDQLKPAPAEAPYAVLIEPSDDGIDPAGMPLVGGVLQRRSWDEMGPDEPVPHGAWVRLGAPPGQEAWRQTLRACEARGVAGVLLPFEPRLLDLIRRLDEEDDRSDLLVAQG